MTSIAIVPLIVTLAGLLVYLLTKPMNTQEKWANIGRWMFIIGLAATLYFGFRL